TGAVQVVKTANPIQLPLPVYPNGVKPTGTTLDFVIDAFGVAPAEAVKNPDGQKGINLHIELGGDMSIPAADWTSFDADGFPTGFSATKTSFFGTPAERNQSPATLNARRLA